MAITEERARELARMLPEGLDCSDGRKRLLSVAELLRAVTDEEHALSNAEIRAVLAAKLGEEAVPAENTLNGDIRALRECGILGYEVHTGPGGTWCENGAFSPGSVRLCLNAVQSSRFLTDEQSDDLQLALGSLVSRWREEEIAYEVHVTQRAPEAGGVLARCDAVAEALRTGKKVEFEYAYNDFSGKQVALARGEDGNTVRVETPIALIFSQGNYYLESFADPPWFPGSKATRSRIDRMTWLRVSREAAVNNSEVRKLKRTARRRMEQDLDLLGGTMRVVFLSVMGRKTNEMIDRFGPGLKYGEFNGPKGVETSTGVTCLRVAESRTFFRWLAGTCGEVMLVPPPMSVTAKRNPWSSVCKGYSYDELEQDYRAMAAGYRAFLKEAAKSCP